MVEMGRIQTLKVDRVDERGAWLKAGNDLVLLPSRELPPGTLPGSELEVFLLLDGEGRPTATLRRPLAQVDEFALLRVKDVSKPGAFLDWGMEKDLLVPYSEQPDRMKPGRRYIVKVCRDSLGRTVATAKIDKCLETEQIDLAEGDEVDLLVWDFTDLGAKVIIDNLYGGLLYRDEIRGGLKRGDRLKGYVRRIREDNKVDVSLSRVGAAGAADDTATLLAALRKEGFLPLHDGSSPEEIRRLLGMSKKGFKRAVGGLYKAGRIELTPEGIRLKKP